MHWRWVRNILAIATLLIAASSGVNAAEQSIIGVQLVPPPQGEIGLISVAVKATNRAKEDLFVEVSSSGEPTAVLCKAFLVPTGQTKECEIALTVSDELLQTVKVVVAAKREPGGTTIESFPYSLYFKVKDGAFTRSSYDALYMYGCSRVTCVSTTGTAVQGLPQPETETPAPFPLPSVVYRDQLAPSADSQTFIVAGKFTYLDLTGRARPAWGWTVNLRWRPARGQPLLLATGGVSSDGSWRVVFRAPRGYSGQNLHISYIPENSFIRFLVDLPTPNGWTRSGYRFSDPVRTNIPQQYSAPETQVNLSESGMYAGLGDTFRHSMRLRNALKSTGMIDVSFGRLTDVIFPNLHYTCGGSDVWSCQDGNLLWIRADHAAAPFTTLHELGHALQWRLWGAFPPNSGGSHSWYECGSKGMALSEGVATAIATMVDAPLNLSSAALNLGGSYVPLETPKYSELRYCDANSNLGSELAVAATIWDLIDRNIDERNNRKDDRNYRYAYAPIGLILRSGAKTSLLDYKDLLKSQQGGETQQWIDDVFEMNDIR
jgi:hypothetical protein